MGKPRFADLGDIDEVEATTGVNIEDAENLAVLVGGTFVGTFSIEFSMDDTTYVTHPDASGKTAPFILVVDYNPFKFVRVNGTAYTSGTMKCWLGARDVDLKP